MATIKKHSFSLRTLAFFSAAAVGILLVRFFLSSRSTYYFLVWNLFLAWVPFLISLVIYKYYKLKPWSSFLFWPLSFVWLVFFPNAPYVVSDFIHLHARGNIPVWFDFVLILMFSISAFLLAVCSLRLMRNVLLKNSNKIVVGFFLGIISLLSGFGIYLGRFLRWNSWDVVLNPWDLLINIKAEIFHPFAYSYSFLFAFLILGFYLILFTFTEFE